MVQEQFHWSQQALIAVLYGLTIEAILVAAFTVEQPPVASKPPMDAVPYFVIIVTLAVFCIPLVYWGRAVGYVVAIVVGALGLLTLILSFSGALGDVPRGNPLGPLIFALLSLGLIVFGIVALRVERK